MSKFELVDFTASNVIGKPDMRRHGITPGVVLYHAQLFPRCRFHPENRHDKYSDWLDEESVAFFVQRHPAGTTFALNLEGPSCDKWGKYPWQWYTHGTAYDTQFALKKGNLDRLIRAVEFCRSIEPANRWTLYGHTPHWMWDDWKYPGWLQMIHDCKPLADVLDLCCPYCYLSAETIIDPANKTEGYYHREHSVDESLHAMRRVLTACRELFETPVYAWVWPEYYWPHWHFQASQDQDTGEFPYQYIADRLMPVDVWQGVVDTAWNYADGLACWGLAEGGPEKPIRFDKKWPWWRVLRSYARRSVRARR